MNFAKFSRKPFLQNTSGRLLLVKTTLSPELSTQNYDAMPQLRN